MPALRHLAAALLVLTALGLAACGGSSRTLTVTAPAGAIQSRAGAIQSRTVKLRSQVLTQTPVSAPARGPDAAGAQLTFTAMLIRPSGGAAIGRSLTSCVRVAPQGGLVYNCTLIFLLPEGTIYGQAVAGPGGPGMGVVSGGTGAYDRVRGTFTYKSTGSPQVGLTFDLG